jgi:hypothetical protein
MGQEAMSAADDPGEPRSTIHALRKAELQMQNNWEVGLAWSVLSMDHEAQGENGVGEPNGDSGGEDPGVAQ